MPRYLCLFAQHLPEFRLPELQALNDLVEGGLKFSADAYNLDSPFLLIELKSEEVAKKILERAILIKGIYELLGCGVNYDQVIDCVETRLQDHYFARYQASDYTFKWFVEAFNKKLTAKYQLEVIKKFHFLPLGGRIDLKNPQVVFKVIEDYGQQQTPPPEWPRFIYMGKSIQTSHRHSIVDLSLKEREYIGTTSMTSELSLIMANLIHAAKGQLVLDPFVGTGSLLIASAHYGAMTIGSDIDPRVIRGKEGKNITSNFQQYGLERRTAEIIVSDNTLPMWRPLPLFDAIITDPPYGVRAGARRLGLTAKQKERGMRPIPQHLRDNHFTPWIPYEIEDVIKDLLEFTAIHLVLNGRFAYWLPITEAEDHTIPSHPCLQYLYHSDQFFGRWGRRLVTMKKIIDYPPPADAIESKTKVASLEDIRIKVYKNRADPEK